MTFLSCVSEEQPKDIEQKIRQGSSSEIVQIAHFEQLLSLDIEIAVQLCRTEEHSDFMVPLQKKCSAKFKLNL